jgi:hypothetical protein
MARPRGRERVLAALLSAALALWLAVAVPVACHHAGVQLLFQADAHDHAAHGHRSHASGLPHNDAPALPARWDGQAERVARAGDSFLAADEACVTHVLYHEPTVIDWLTVPAAALPPALLLIALWVLRLLESPAMLSPPDIALPSHHPPPRLAPAVGA